MDMLKGVGEGDGMVVELFKRVILTGWDEWLK